MAESHIYVPILSAGFKIYRDLSKATFAIEFSSRPELAIVNNSSGMKRIEARNAEWYFRNFSFSNFGQSS